MCNAKIRGCQPVSVISDNNCCNSSQSVGIDVFRGTDGSGVHTTGTFEQFSKPITPDFDGKNGFISVNNRFTNLDIVRALESCSSKENPHIKKVIKGLSCCSSMALIESNGEEARLVQTSKKCRRNICPICNRIKSAKYVNRFVSAYNSPVGRELFDKKYFSLITLTLKHNRVDTRNRVYLGELKGYLKRLQRSKLWKKHFPYTKQNPLSGWANCFEVTITKNGFHIHVHILVCAPRYSEKVSKIQEDFSNKWETITGDSRGCFIDLIKLDKSSKRAMREGSVECSFMGAVLEVFKYSVKVGDSKKLASNIDDLAQFIIDTKGANMVVAGGFFRGLGLFSKKSIWDEELGGEEGLLEINEENEYFVGRTVDVEYSKNPNRSFKRESLNDVYLRGFYVADPEDVRGQIFDAIRDNRGRKYKDYSDFPKVFFDITDCVSSFYKYFQMEVSIADFKNLPDWVLYCQERAFIARKAVVKDEVRCDLLQLRIFNVNDSGVLENKCLHQEFW